MENISYRKICKKDYYYIKRMINNQFCLYEYIDDKRILKTFLNVYLYDCLVEKTFSMVAEKDGNVVGVILGNAKTEYRVIKTIINKIKSIYYTIIMIIKIIKYKYDIKQYKGITKIYKELIEKSNRNFDGILTLFVVDKDYQGYGIGKTLLSYLLNYGREKNIKKMYLYTDSKCNYKFYDKSGFKNIGKSMFEVKNKNNEFELEIFLYEYNF